MRYNFKNELALWLILATIILAYYFAGCTSQYELTMAKKYANLWEASVSVVASKNRQIDSLEIALEKCRNIQELKVVR